MAFTSCREGGGVSSPEQQRLEDEILSPCRLLLKRMRLSGREYFRTASGACLKRKRQSSLLPDAATGLTYFCRRSELASPPAVSYIAGIVLCNEFHPLRAGIFLPFTQLKASFPSWRELAGPPANQSVPAFFPFPAIILFRVQFFLTVMNIDDTERQLTLIIGEAVLELLEHNKVITGRLLSEKIQSMANAATTSSRRLACENALAESWAMDASSHRPR